MIISACGQEENKSGAVVDELTVIEVELAVPEFAEVGEVVTFSSAVTQGDELVEDANEVVYEIWLEGQKETSELIEADHQEGHLYTLEYTFNEAGMYHVQTHVTARGLHRMPTVQIQVGEMESSVEEHKHEEVHENDHHEHHHHHHHDVDVETELTSEQLRLHILVEGIEYTDGNVTLEMWQDGDEVRQWVDMKEVGNGFYQLENLEELQGEYMIIVHIQDDDLHEHIDLTLDF